MELSPCYVLGGMTVSTLPDPRPQPDRRRPKDSFRSPDARRGAQQLTPRFIKAEANLLRLPLFALSTKGLRTLDGIECRGTITRNDETHSFVFRASRNTATLYPGLLSRAVHLAFLSLATDRGFPLTNPISWGWRDLCRRMGICSSGREVQQIKTAIEATSGLSIKSHYAVYSKPDGRMIRTQDEGLHLYERYAFIGSELPDGSVAEANYLWLSGWYLDNLNAMFTAPLDYELWRWLDRQSPIASRLYEFLLVNFYSGTPLLRINYEKLAQFLPVKLERYRSDARRQLDPAFKLLELADVIEGVAWAESKSGLALLRIERGDKVAVARIHAPLPLHLTEDDYTGSLEVKELRNLKPPEWTIVGEFYRLWSGTETHRPTKNELEQARGLVEQHGPKKAKDLISRVVARLKTRWPEAKTFGAAQKYLPEIAREYDCDQERIEREQQEQLRRQKEREEREQELREQERIESTWRPVWEQIPEAEREAIRRGVIGEHPFLRSVPKMVERLCLAELARWREEPPKGD
jgi:hypothetical protein